VNATPQISGAATPHGPSPAPSPDSSLAGLLLAGSASSADQDFRSIAAAMFGAASTAANQAPTATKDSIAAKRNLLGPAGNEFETRKGKAAADPASSATAHPELTAPLLNISPSPLPTDPKQTGSEQAAPTPEAMMGPLDLQQISARLESAALAVNPAASNASASAARDEALNQQFALSETLSEIMPSSPARQQDVTAAAIEDDGLKRTLSSADNPLTQAPAIGDGVKQGQEAAAQIASIPIISATTKKSSSGTQDASTGGTVKHASARTTIIGKVAQPAGASMSAPSSDQLPAAASDSTPSVSAPGQTSAVPVNTIVDTSAANALQRSGSVAQDSKSARGVINGQAKIKDRNPDRVANDRSDKDVRLGSGQDGKSILDQSGRNAAGSANLGSNSKDAAELALQNHAGAHAKPAPLKDSAASPSSSTVQTDADGPDEVPASASSPVATAKLVQGMSQSEFRVGMQSQEFGSIDIRTSVARHMFSAQISVEHSDMAKSLTADLPALFHKLADQQVAVASITIHGQSLATSSGLAQDAQPRGWRPQSEAATKLDAEPVLPAMSETLEAAGRLDIRI